MKKYEEPIIKLHQLKTAQMIAESFEVPAKSTENPQSQEDDGMQGFTVRDGWE